MELKNIKIKDDFSLMISLYGKSVWRKDENDELEVCYLVDREKDNCMLTSISCTEVKPSIDRKKLMEVLKYFFPVCDEYISPQCMWGTDDCDYISLMLDYEIGKNQTLQSKERFENVFVEMTKYFPELKQSEKFLEKIPDGKSLLDMVCCIEVAYPKTWNAYYLKE